MTLNHINFVIGFVAGIALAIWLRPKPTTDRDDNVHVLRKPLKGTG